MKKNIKLTIKLILYIFLYSVALLVSKRESSASLSNVKKLYVISRHELSSQSTAGDNLLKDIIYYGNKLSNINFKSLKVHIKTFFNSNEAFAFRSLGVGLLLLIFKKNSKLVYVSTDLHHQREGDYDDNLKILKRIFLRITESIEKLIWKRVDLIFYNREDEADFIKFYTNKNKLFYIPLIVMENITFKKVDVTKKSIKFLFIGGAGNKPNVPAVNFILNKLLPQIEVSLNKELTFFLIGKGWNINSKKYKTKIVNYEYVTEKELKEIYEIIDFSICPLTYGTGLKGKVLESIKYGKVPIGTNIAYEGLDLKKNFCPTINEYINHFESLIDNQNLFNELEGEIETSLGNKFNIEKYKQLFNILN